MALYLCIYRRPSRGSEKLGKAPKVTGIGSGGDWVGSRVLRNLPPPMLWPLPPSLDSCLCSWGNSKDAGDTGKHLTRVPPGELPSRTRGQTLLLVPAPPRWSPARVRPPRRRRPSLISVILLPHSGLGCDGNTIGASGAELNSLGLP